MNLYVEGDDVYYCPNDDGNATLVDDGDDNLLARIGAVTSPGTTILTLERSIDGGETWQPVTGEVNALESFAIMDWQGLSRGDTLYRATAYAVSGASADAVVDIPADSNAVWLAAGPTFADPAKTLYNPDREQKAGRDRTTHTVLGRELPVVFSGEQLTDTLTVSGRIASLRYSGGEVTATRERLIDVVQDPSPVHLYRDQEGSHVYSMVGAIRFTRVVSGVEDWSLNLTRVIEQEAPDE